MPVSKSTITTASIAGLPVGPIAAFGWRVVRAFFRNKGLLLASAVGYNALLSLIPLLVITLVVLTHFYDDALVSHALVARVRPLAPGLAPAVREAISSFLASRHLVGWGGLGVLVVVSSVAFRMLEEAMAVIFRRPRRLRPRRPTISLLIQFGYVPFVGLGVALLTGLTWALKALGDGVMFGVRWFAPLAGALPTIVAAAGFVGLWLLLASFYWIMPVVKVRFRLALIGGLVAAVLWMMLNTALAWFFEHLSLVNVLYGSLGGIIIVLLSMEAFAVILLLGAQIVAEVDRSWRAGLKWYERPPDVTPLSIEAR
jgi:YihY family inner membrane protein